MQLRYLWLQDLYNSGECNLHNVGTLDNLGDLLTKYVNVTILNTLNKRVGMVDLHLKVTSFPLNVINLDYTVTRYTHDLYFIWNVTRLAMNVMMHLHCFCFALFCLLDFASVFLLFELYFCPQPL